MGLMGLIRLIRLMGLIGPYQMSSGFSGLS